MYCMKELKFEAPGRSQPGIFPVRCLDFGDLVKSTEGFTALPTEAGQRALPQIDFSTMLPLLGYNKTLPKKGAEILLYVKETKDPLLAVREFGKGWTLAFTSDPAPHWGCNFVFWDRYNDFWLQCLDFLLSVSV
jgi:uncharacterized membrane protein